MIGVPARAAALPARRQQLSRVPRTSTYWPTLYESSYPYCIIHRSRYELVPSQPSGIQLFSPFMELLRRNTCIMQSACAVPPSMQHAGCIGPRHQQADAGGRGRNGLYEYA
jgi:hypothetical protein